MLRRFSFLSLLALVAVTVCLLLAFPQAGRPQEQPPAAPAPRAPRDLRADPRWSRLDAAAEETIQAGGAPGVVMLVSHGGKVLYRKAFGNRAVTPAREPMTEDTLFDLASLTKVIATTSAVMALVEEDKIRLEEPAARYWPEFGQNGKEAVTLRQLMTHSSGLPAWVNYETRFRDPSGPAVQDHREAVMAAIAALPLQYPTDTRQVYSDLGFLTLGEIVRRVTGEPLDRYVRHRIFEPLGMKETCFNPDEPLRARCAPTTTRGGVQLRGLVHDPNSGVCGGVAGHAGLFSTADDLERFTRVLLSRDHALPTGYPLKPETVRRMTYRATPDNLRPRGLGWDIDSAYAHVKGKRMPLGSFGHTGFTGTFLWIDPFSDTALIGLSNRVHPDGKGDVLKLWAKMSDIVSEIVAEPNSDRG